MLILLLTACGQDEQKGDRVTFGTIMFCMQTNEDGSCSSGASNFRTGTSRINTSVDVDFSAANSIFNFSWYVVNSKGCRDLVASEDVTPDADGSRTLTGYILHSEGLPEGILELEISFRTAKKNDQAVARVKIES